MIPVIQSFTRHAHTLVLLLLALSVAGCENTVEPRPTSGTTLPPEMSSRYSSPLTNLPVLPRLGIQLHLPATIDRMTWYGHGPHENYIDRKESSLVGVYSSKIKDDYVPYIYPQEYGNKSDVRWAVLNDIQGQGIIAVTPPNNTFLNISAHEYSVEAVTKAQHTYELQKCEDVILNIDHLQAGLGSNSCGPGPLSNDLIEPKEYNFSIRMRHFNWDEDTRPIMYTSKI